MTNKTKPQSHTPGPWAYTMEKRRQYGQTIHTAHISPAGPDALFNIAHLDPVTTREHAEANARLIAAAPDLLESACAVLKSADNYRLPNPVLIDALRAAIAKAQGDR